MSGSIAAATALKPRGPSAPAAITAAYRSSASIAEGAAGPYTMSNVAIGAADASRVVVACVTLNSESGDVTGVTIGGVAATQAISANGTSNRRSAVSIWYASVPTGSSADVVVAVSATVSYWTGIDVFTLVGGTISLASASDVTSSFTGFAGTFTSDVPAGGAAIYLTAGAEGGAPSDSTSWSGASKGSFAGPGNFHRRATGYHTTAAAETAHTATMNTSLTASISHGQVLAVFGTSGTIVTALDTSQLEFTTVGQTFAPALTLTGSPTVLWTFSDGSTSSSATPSKDFGSAATRVQKLKVTPWSGLIGINLGYTGEDGGTSTIANLAQQNVSKVDNLSLTKDDLQFFTCSYTPMTALDFGGFTALTTIECYYCHSLANISLNNTSALTRLCVEGAKLTSLDLSQSPLLADLRGAWQQTSALHVNWGSTGAHTWHVCIRDNPGFTGDLPWAQLPVLYQLWIWDCGLTGTIAPASTALQDIAAQNQPLTGIDLSGAPNVRVLRLQSTNINQAMVDYVLATLDAHGQNGGTLEIQNTVAPSATGLAHASSLAARGWTVTHD
jgi:hypothetical protein